MYVLDEPSIGLHQRDNARLLETLRRLRDLGNTVIVVEHDEDAIRAAKRMYNQLSVDPGPALLAESVEQQKLIGSANQTEAVRANMEKRAPNFVDP